MFRGWGVAAETKTTMDVYDIGSAPVAKKDEHISLVKGMIIIDFRHLFIRDVFLLEKYPVTTKEDQ